MFGFGIIIPLLIRFVKGFCYFLEQMFRKRKFYNRKVILMTAISVNGLTLRYGITTILKDITFSLEEDDKLGIVGINGCGKSSLFRLITGEEERDSGEIYIAKGKTVGILRQDGAFTLPDGVDENATPAELMVYSYPELLKTEKELDSMKRKLDAWSGVSDNNFYTALAQSYTDLHAKYIADGGMEFRSRCVSVLRRMGFDDEMLARPVHTLSGGQKTRLAISVQLCRDPDILLLDEPTNHLDIETLGWLENYLASYRKCVLVISHDRYFLDRVTNKTLFIEHTHGKMFSGSYTPASALREDADRVAEKHYWEQQKYIKHQEEYIAQQRAWGREKNIKRAESREKLLDKIERLERPKEAPRPIKLKFSKQHSSGNDVLYVRGLGFEYPGNRLFSGLDFLLKQNERLFIIGKNGCGKSTLVKLLTGQLEPTEGYVEAGYNVEIGCYDQENRTLTDTNTVLSELWNAYPDKTELEIRSTLAAFRFYEEDTEKTVAKLSGGERARLMLSKLIMSKMNLLILDEPTNHLDISSREALEEAIDAFDGTVLCVSHDRYFINKLATRVIEICPGNEFGTDQLDCRIEKKGSAIDEFFEYKRTRKTLSASAESEKAVTAANEQFIADKKNRSRERSEQRRLERMAKEQTELEAELDLVTEELYGDAATDYVRAATLEARKNEIEERLMEIYETLGI